MATMKNRVLWQEGMFALPQHFQQQQRHNDAMLRERLDALGDFAWGFTELSLNTELLAQGKVMIDRAAGCLPDGTVFRIPEQDLLPQPYQPRELTTPESHDIYLALPVATHNISEVQGIRSAGQSSERYSVARTEVRDVHSPDGDMQSLTLGQLGPKIVSGAEDLSAMVVLPLCRIRSFQSGGALVLDDDFIPTCQTLRVSPVLNRFVGDVQGLIATRAADLAKRIGSPEQSGIADVAEFMMLQMLNRWQMHFSHRARLHTLHPEIFYLDLVSLLGELMTFTENSRLPCTVEFYDHRDLTQSFKTVIPELRRALNIVLQPRAQNLPLIFTEGVYLATVNDPGLLQSGVFVLAVRARMPHTQLILQFTQQSKIAATDKIRNMVSVQVPGIPLRALPAAPRQLPYHDGYVYFELEKGSSAWQDVVKAGALAMHISGTFPELDMQLWAIRG
ncbi:type VI secretion system baseplate subunit TssK [Citrobacter portucalensis]|uniref:type VI secretion system baseplate subunit TssK n=1 Tax=Citrobacter portucalensis TaxID=1639133 RepID=UPI000F4492FB|nr:type VI secretion system baseplate subunit TssK [Citrobacter portucalensis]MBA8419187.1 type VI secretion system baseplate subunit TssK [Citrobacter freundii]RNL75588.1 type VI secretion system baseplate subunit TssK [Citrobacter sp. MH181794]MDE9612452.1 type VI secretion system baseplate subunit TssK [Citrobacter portucalensis]QMM95714.1 type VI secretion system baseplate subunit TssK [Citrobacter freundii]WFZ22723.1 type VI secretion system baseplate subunit TssK [Citrobacter portucalens